MAAKDVPGSAPAHSALGGAQWTNCNWALLVSQHVKPRVPSLPSAYRPTSVNSHLDTHLAKGYFIGALGRGSIFFLPWNRSMESAEHTQRASMYMDLAWREKWKDGINALKWVWHLPPAEKLFGFTLCFLKYEKICCCLHFINVISY